MASGGADASEGGAAVPEYDEMALFHENAEEVGLPWDGSPAVERRSVVVDEPTGRRVSGLVWGSGEPELVLLHGGAQNAHTWDTVALALDRPLVAIDLPGHGHSDAPAGGSLDVRTNAADVACAVRELAPEAGAVVGMSLGGLTAIALADTAPDLVRRAVLVDVTPRVEGPGAAAIVAFVNGPESFADFDELLARTVEFNPTRSVSSLRRGILHNALQRDDGSWVWRYRRFTDGNDVGEAPDRDLRAHDLWDALSRIQVPLMLVRGMRPGSVVDDDAEAELRRRLPQARVEHVAEAGHSVQGDDPLTLAALLADFVP